METTVARDLTRGIVSLLLLAALAMIGSGCALSIGGWDWNGSKVQIADSDDLEYSASGIQLISCRSHNGGIKVAAAADDQIRVAVEIRARGTDDEDAQECLEAVDVFGDRVDGELRLGWRWRRAPHRR